MAKNAKNINSVRSPKIGVLSPNWSFLSGERSMHVWAEKFIKKYCDAELSYEEAKNYKGDIIVQLHGRPDLPENCPPKQFGGLKLVHVMDYNFQTERAVTALQENRVEYLLGYSRHDLYDSFFQTFYKEWLGRVIPVPFGYNSHRFKVITPFSQRLNQCVALGSVNPVSDPLCIADIKEFAEYFSGEKFTHKWRRTLAEKKFYLTDELDSLLPEYPRTKDFDYDIVDAYNRYTMFTSCESIMNYPSVKTYEGMACGSVLVCSEHPCYTDLGLIGDFNCIKHRQNDVENFKNKVGYYQSDLDALKEISLLGNKLVEEKFTPEAVADDLFFNILNIWM